MGLVYLQLVLGAVVRHKDFAFGARAHLLTAFAVVAVVAWLVKEVLESPQSWVFQQAENRLHAQKGLLVHLLG